MDSIPSTVFFLTHSLLKLPNLDGVMIKIEALIFSLIDTRIIYNILMKLKPILLNINLFYKNN
jgi:hypothetical protein